MRKRQDLVEQFSTFVWWDNSNRFQKWISDPRLHRIMENLLSQEFSSSKQSWVLFWHKDWLNQRQNLYDLEQERQNHALDAYLQEPCYHAAKAIEREYQNRLSYTIEDYFNIGFLKSDQILSRFNPKLNTNLAAFAYNKIKWCIVDEVRCLNRTLGHTIWGLLLSCTETRLKKALIRLGISLKNIENYLDVWDFFKEFYPRDRLNGRYQEPNPQIWEQITNAYNQKYPDAQLDPKTVKEYLETCGKALLNYLSPPTTSMNTTQPGEGETEWGDTFSDQNEINNIEQLVLEQGQEQINFWLKEAIVKLNPEREFELIMCYGEKLTQDIIATRMNVNQSTINRRIHKSIKILTENFIEWSRENYNSCLEADDLENISYIIEQWLEDYYQNIGNQ